MAYHGIEEQIEYDKLSKNEASKKIDKILSEKGRIFDQDIFDSYGILC